MKSYTQLVFHPFRRGFIYCSTGKSSSMAYSYSSIWLLCTPITFEPIATAGKLSLLWHRDLHFKSRRESFESISYTLALLPRFDFAFFGVLFWLVNCNFSIYTPGAEADSPRKFSVLRCLLNILPFFFFFVLSARAIKSAATLLIWQLGRNVLHWKCF